MYLTAPSHGPGRGRTGVRDVETEAYRFKDLSQVTGFFAFTLPFLSLSHQHLCSASFQRYFVQILINVYTSELPPSPHILYTVLYFTDMLCLGDCPMPGCKGRPHLADQSIHLNNNYLISDPSGWAGRIFSIFCYSKQCCDDNRMCLPLCTCANITSEKWNFCIEQYTFLWF